MITYRKSLNDVKYEVVITKIKAQFQISHFHNDRISYIIYVGNNRTTQFTEIYRTFE